MTKKNIIIVTGHSKLDSGGVGTHLRLLIDAMHKTEFFISVVMGGGYICKLYNLFNKFSDKFLGLHKSFESLSPLINILFLEKKLEKTINKIGENKEFIVHCHDRSSTIAAYRLKSKYKIKIVQTVHAPFSLQYEIHPLISKSLTPLYIRGLDEKSCKFADHYIAVDELQKRLLLNSYGGEIDSNKITIIHNAVEQSLLEMVENKRHDYFVVARHLHEKNGVEYAIRAFAHLKKQKDGLVKLKIIGFGPLEKDLRSLTVELGVMDSVEFLGAQPRKKCIELISSAIGSIVPSIPVGDYIEATSLTMLESMALKTPLIASNIGGIKEVLDGKGAAFLVEPKDYFKISDAMIKIIERDPVVSVKTSVAYDIIKDFYTVDKWVKKIVNAYAR